MKRQIFVNYTIAILIVFLCTLIGILMPQSIHHSNLIMLYLLAVVIIATRDASTRGPSICAALLGTICFDFFFIPPYNSFAVSDIQYFFTLVVMLIVSQIISHLMIRIQKSIEAEKNAKFQTETERLRNILLTSISHDLRTPLAAIMGSASSLIAMPTALSDNQNKELLQNIYDESKRLNQLVTNVLQIIRLEAGAIKINKQNYAIEDIIGSTLEVLNDAITNKNLTIQFEVSPSLPFTKLDPVLIEQVLINLLDNAIKQSNPNNYLKIKATYDAQTILIKIADRGPGIPENEIAAIFKKFHQSEASSHKNNSGFGLGLAICKNIIEAHNGRIWAENRKGGGSVFCFTLPIRDENNGSTQAINYRRQLSY